MTVQKLQLGLIGAIILCTGELADAAALVPSQWKHYQDDHCRFRFRYPGRLLLVVDKTAGSAKTECASLRLIDDAGSWWLFLFATEHVSIDSATSIRDHIWRDIKERCSAIGPGEVGSCDRVEIVSVAKAKEPAFRTSARFLVNGLPTGEIDHAVYFFIEQAAQLFRFNGRPEILRTVDFSSFEPLSSEAANQQTAEIARMTEQWHATARAEVNRLERQRVEANLEIKRAEALISPHLTRAIAHVGVAVNVSNVVETVFATLGMRDGTDMAYRTREEGMPQHSVLVFGGDSRVKEKWLIALPNTPKVSNDCVSFRTKYIRRDALRVRVHGCVGGFSKRHWVEFIMHNTGEGWQIEPAADPQK